jgi:hypothetical protein
MQLEISIERSAMQSEELRGRCAINQKKSIGRNAMQSEELRGKSAINRKKSIEKSTINQKNLERKRDEQSNISEQYKKKPKLIN